MKFLALTLLLLISFYALAEPDVHVEKSESKSSYESHSASHPSDPPITAKPFMDSVKETFGFGNQDKVVKTESSSDSSYHETHSERAKRQTNPQPNYDSSASDESSEEVFGKRPTVGLPWSSQDKPSVADNVQSTVPNPVHPAHYNFTELDQDFSIEHLQEDLINARDGGLDKLQSFVNIIRTERHRLKRKYQQLKTEAHDKSNEWHHKLEQMKELEKQAKDEIDSFNRVGASPPVAELEEEESIHKMKDLHEHKTDSASVDDEIHGHKLNDQPEKREGFFDRLIHRLEMD